MTVEAGFLADICAHPDDDAPRLIYADWLEERGQRGDAARAEFIRVQCALERGDGDAREQSRLRERQGALLKKHLTAWARPCGTME